MKNILYSILFLLIMSCKNTPSTPYNHKEMPCANQKKVFIDSIDLTVTDIDVTSNLSRMVCLIDSLVPIKKPYCYMDTACNYFPNHLKGAFKTDIFYKMSKLRTLYFSVTNPIPNYLNEEYTLAEFVYSDSLSANNAYLILQNQQWGKTPDAPSPNIKAVPGWGVKAFLKVNKLYVLTYDIYNYSRARNIFEQIRMPLN